MFSYLILRRWLLQLARPYSNSAPPNVRTGWLSLRASQVADSDACLFEDGWDYVTIATYDKSTDAHIAKGRLAAEGINALLFDDNMVQMDWLYAIALGGIKLRVKSTDARLARSILATDYSEVLDGVDVGTPDP